MTTTFDIQPDARRMLEAAGLHTLGAWLALRRQCAGREAFHRGDRDDARHVRVLSRHSDRVTLSLEIPDPDRGGEPVRLFAKTHFAVSAFHLLSKLVRRGTPPTAAPVNEHRWLSRLAAAGIDTMQPVALGERRVLGWPRAAVLVVREVPAERSLFQRLRDGDGGEFARDAALWSAVGGVIGSLSARGFEWCDISAKHLYPRQADGRWQLFLIDVERMEQVRACDDAMMFRELLATLPAAPPMSTAEAMAAGYRAAGGRGPLDAAAIGALIDREFRRRPAIPPDYWLLRPAAMICDAGLVVRSNWRDALNAVGLTDLDAIFAFDAGQSLAKPGLPPERRRDRVVLGDGRVIYLKRYRPSPWQRAARVLALKRRGSVAGDEWRMLYRLANGGVPVPEPVLFGESGERASARAFVGLAEIPDAESLEKWLPRVGPTLSAARRGELFARLAEFVARFHALGTVHRDLYTCHIFIRWAGDCGASAAAGSPAPPDTAPSASGPVFWLIDLARAFRPRRWRRGRWIVKDLAQLRYSLGEWITDAEWTEFLTHYAAAPDGIGGRLPARIARKVRSISAHAARRRHRLGLG